MREARVGGDYATRELMYKIHLIAALMSLLFISQTNADPIAGQVDTFEDGTSQGWGAGNANSTTVIATSEADLGPGGLGDSALQTTFNLRAAFLNQDARWIGDYTAAGISAIEVDVNNTTTVDLNLRLGIRGPDDPFLFPQGGGDSWITNSQTVTANSGWTTLTFGITAADITSPGTGADASAALTDVQQLRFIDNAAAEFKGRDVDANENFTILVDNITAIGTLNPGTPEYALGIDFGSIAPAVGTNFNQFDIDTADGETATLAAGTLIGLDGNNLNNISFSLTNNTGQDTTRADVTNGAEGDGAEITDATIFGDAYISNNQGAAPINADANFVLTFSGLDDSLTYALSGGWDNNNNNFDADWTVDGATVLADVSANGYVGFEGLATDGNGNLSITVSRSTLHVTLGALTLSGFDSAASLNCDSAGAVECDLADIDALYAMFGSTVAAGSGFDYSGDGVVGPEDIAGWLADASQTANTANPTGATYVLGDADLDGNVNSIDLGLLLNNFNAMSGVGWNQGDLNGDGNVNSVDLGQLLNNFGFTSLLAANAVPEPGNCGLIGIVLLGLLARRR